MRGVWFDEKAWWAGDEAWFESIWWMDDPLVSQPPPLAKAAVVAAGRRGAVSSVAREGEVAAAGRGGGVSRSGTGGAVSSPGRMQEVSR